MAARAVIGIVGGLAVLAAAAAAAALDASKADEIASGVRVGRIDIGGLERAEAAARLRRELVEPMERPVAVRLRGEIYRLDADELHVRADIDGMVSEALAVSRDGWIGSRLIRYATAASSAHRVETRISYSQIAVARLVEQIAQDLNRTPVDASLRETDGRLAPAAGKPGYALREAELRTRVNAAIESGAGGRRLEASVSKLRPETTVADLRRDYPTYVVVDRDDFTLRLYRNLRLVREYPVAIGQAGYETPAGVYGIDSKQLNPTWYVPDAEWAGELAGSVVPPGPDNPLKARWMGFNGAAGIHGTADAGSLGSAASHGCVRMAVPDVIDLYEHVPLGTPVRIE
ncbi:MAG: L,D-transpeptidase family protein [Solirubrobacterales bacterium]